MYHRNHIRTRNYKLHHIPKCFSNFLCHLRPLKAHEPLFSSNPLKDAQYYEYGIDYGGPQKASDIFLITEDACFQFPA